MRLEMKPRPIEVEAFEWMGHEGSPELAEWIGRFDLAGNRPIGIGYETILNCCGQIVAKHGWVRHMPVEYSGMMCPDMWLVIEHDVLANKVLRARAMKREDIDKEYVIK